METVMSMNDYFGNLNMGLPEDILRRKIYGDYEGAIRLIDRRLARDDQPQALREALITQKEIIRRLPLDYPLSRAEALSLVREHIADFTEEEFDERVDAGQIWWIYVNGEMRYFNRFFASLCKVDADFSRRAGIGGQGVESAKKGSKEDNLLDITRRRLAAEGKLTRRIRIRASLKLKDDNFTPGMFIRAHLPIPAECDDQSDVRIERVWPETAQIAPGNALQRTVCWEENMEENHEFTVEYSYIRTARYNDLAQIRPDAVQPDFFTEEVAPHLVFTPYIRKLVAELTEGVSDPLEKARRFYDFITLKMKYNFMPQYFTQSSIAENAALNFSGDCGVLTLLFITLCRCAGIPARWQSGYTAEPAFLGAHDWARFYIAPYGWLYADCSYGTGAVRADNEERRVFYFGNLDPFRMAANNAFQADFTVNKQHWRADPCDNQLGEMETSDRGFTWEEFERSKELLECEEVQAPENRFSAIIEKNMDDMIRDLQGCLRIPSVYANDESPYPYGRKIQDCLEYVLRSAESMGFATVNMDNHLGWCEYGEGEEMVAVLGHLDVVPEGEDWTQEPYGANIVGDRLYARGAMDDKGPTMAALYALKAIKESGLPLKRRVRILFGCNEESGSADMKYYREHGGEMPVMGFTPDGEYPVINGEKGLINEAYACSYEQSGPLYLKEIRGGTAHNIVPDYAKAVFLCEPELAEKIAESKAERVSFRKTDTGVIIEADGINAHGGTPEEGINAIGLLVKEMAKLPLEGQLATAIRFLAEKLGTEYDGASLGIAMTDELSGPLTNNLGVIAGDDKGLEVKLNYRYPVTKSFDMCGPQLRAAFEAAGFRQSAALHKKALYVPAESELIRRLMKVYTDCTGDREAQPKSIGGGTYAKMLPNVVAFGPIFPGDEVREHKPDEFMELGRLKDNANIIAEAMYSLAT